MAPMLNYSFAFGQGIAEEAIRHGTSPEAAGYAVWPVSLLGGLVPNVAYCIYLLQRKRTWSKFRGAWQPDVWLGCLMGVFWMGAFALYGVSSVYLGALGTSVGWALFQIFMIMTANLSGVLTGEWKGAPRAAMRGLWAGLALLAVATAVIAAGNR
jgi:L-rhamnose-H+ transport protein